MFRTIKVVKNVLLPENENNNEQQYKIYENINNKLRLT